MGKKALYLKYSEWAPTIMELAGIKRGHGDQVKLAEALGIKPQSITKFIQRDQLPTDRILLFWINNHLPMNKLEAMISGKKEGGDGYKMEMNKHPGDRQTDQPATVEVPREQPTAIPQPGEVKRVWTRREEDIYYKQVPAIRESGPEWSEGRQILKLFLLKPIFGPSCNLDKLTFIVLEESNFHPTVPAGTILVVDTSNTKITSALYIFRYAGDSFALRKIDPIDDQTIRVTTGTTDTSESRDMPLDKVRPMIVGRVVWAVYKI